MAHHRTTARLSILAGAVAVLALTGCASGGARLQQVTWAQRVKSMGVDPREIPNPLEVSDEMRQALKEAVPSGDPRDQLVQIQHYLFDDKRFPFTYDAQGTYTAKETFERRSGNCVSFTNLFIALARSLGIGLQPALVLRGGVEKEGNLVVINTHLIAVYAHADGVTMYDFAEERDQPIKGMSALDDLWLTAIFLNNHGVDALRAERFDEAIHKLTLATRLAPDFTAAYGNLGVAQRMAGDADGALATYRRALEIESRSPTILNNLASLYRSMGQESEARAALQAADLSNASPYLLITRGDLEAAQGNHQKAMKYYRRARRASPHIPGPWLAIARLEIRRNHLDAARRALDRAIKLAPESPEVQRLGKSVERLIDRRPSTSSR